MPRTKIKFHTLKVFLIKENLEMSDILSNPPLEIDCNTTLTSIEQDILLDISEFISTDYVYKLVLKKPKTNFPAWSDFFPSKIKIGFVSKLFTASAAAVLFVQSNSTTYAIVFGRGRYMLKSDSYERDFGLKVVLNSVDPNLIRSLDTNSLDDFIFHETKQSSKATSFDSYELRPQQDLLKGVAGIPKKTAFKFNVRFIAGSDVLAINAGIKIDKLGKLCSNIYEKYIGEEYKRRFAFIDNLRIVKEFNLVSSLNDILVNTLKDAKTHQNVNINESVIVAPPDTVDFKDLEGICFYSIYKREAERNFEDKIDIDIFEWLQFVPNSTDITITKFKQEKVAVKIDSVYTPKWSIFDSIIFETRHRGKQYILSNGLWYIVDDNLINQVNAKITSIDQAGFSLLDANLGEHEGDYNVRIVNSDTSRYILMDRKNISVDNRVIEFCDIIRIDSSLGFIHVKRKTQSATLSHLFAQGRISGTLFKRTKDFRDKVAKKIKKTAVKRLISPSGILDMTKYRIIYAIITKHNQNWPLSLPFFSKLNLKNTAEELELLGYKVSLLRINQL